MYCTAMDLCAKYESNIKKKKNLINHPSERLFDLCMRSATLWYPWSHCMWLVNGASLSLPTQRQFCVPTVTLVYLFTSQCHHGFFFSIIIHSSGCVHVLLKEVRLIFNFFLLNLNAAALLMYLNNTKLKDVPSRGVWPDYVSVCCTHHLKIVAQ